MSSGMPELGSKISLISKADIRYEGELFTVDPNECTIALSNGKYSVSFSFNFTGLSVNFVPTETLVPTMPAFMMHRRFQSVGTPKKVTN